jgi:hypothetical protein
MAARRPQNSGRSDSNEAILNSIQSIEQRLHDGYAKIDEGQASGRDIVRWEDVWIDLLREYEGLMDRLAA